jgi:hypothetical protein
MGYNAMQWSVLEFTPCLVLLVSCLGLLATTYVVESRKTRMYDVRTVLP